MRIETLDLTKEEHYKEAEKLYLMNEKWLKDDYTPDFKTLAGIIQANLEYNGKGVICYVNGELYGILFARIDRFNIADIHALTNQSHHFFISQKFLRAFVEYLFEFEGVNKIKAEVIINNSNSEIACRYAGFTKEGLLRNERKINSRFHNVLLLAITRKDYDFQCNKFPNRDRKFYKDIKKELRSNLLEIIRKIKNGRI